MTKQNAKRIAACTVVVGLSAIGAWAQQPPQSDEVKRLLATRSCADCFLANSPLTAADLEGAVLTGANLFEATLYFANLEKANLTNATLVGANLRKARLKDATLTGADLTGADLTWATDANFSGAITTATTTCPGGTAGPCI
jgi:uncharacterized protein YjbI with pentapeptide repeats